MIRTFALVTLLLVTACASGHKSTSAKLRALLLANKHDEAIALLQKSPLAKDKKSRLLYLIELGILQHYKADYKASNQSLSEAKIILDMLYTTKVSGKIASALINDNEDFYYSEKYEASMIYFYSGLNYYLSGELEKARAEVLDWDTFLTEMKNDRAGKVHFKNDLLAKTFGAFIHEAQNNTKDDQIALQLYKDAADVFFKNYNLYPTFNTAYKDFRENFKILPNLSMEEVEGKYVRATKHTPVFNEFLTTKILMLTRKVRPGDLQNQIAKYRPSEDVLKKIQVAESNVTFLIQDGLIVEKEAKEYEIPMVWGPHAAAAMALNMGATIHFELPIIKSLPQLELARIQAWSKEGVLVDEAPLSVVSPLDDIAEQAINEHSTAIASKTAARVAAKHLSAFLAAQASLKVSESRNDTVGLVGALVGTIGHAATIAAINSSEKADVRFWSSLPSNIRMGQLSLINGDYKVRAVFGTEGSPFYRVVELGEQKVVKGMIKLVINQNFKSNDGKVAVGNEVKVVEEASRSTASE